MTQILNNILSAYGVQPVLIKPASETSKKQVSISPSQKSPTHKFLSPIRVENLRPIQKVTTKPYENVTYYKKQIDATDQNMKAAANPVKQEALKKNNDASHAQLRVVEKIVPISQDKQRPVIRTMSQEIVPIYYPSEAKSIIPQEPVTLEVKQVTPKEPVIQMSKHAIKPAAKSKPKPQPKKGFEFRYYGQQYSNQTAVQELVEALRNGEQYVTFSRGQIDMHKLWEIIRLDYPEFWQMDMFCGGQSLQISSHPQEEVLDINKKLEEIVKPDELRKRLQNSSTLEKQLAIYEILKGHEYGFGPHNQSIYGNIVLKKSVCAGFAAAYKYLSDIVGIKSIIIHGEADGLWSGGHAWNMTEVDGNWYHVDPTFDRGTDAHLYLNIDDETCFRDHRLTGQKVPSATHLEKNYYRAMDLRLSNESNVDDQLVNLFLRLAKSGTNVERGELWLDGIKLSNDAFRTASKRAATQCDVIFRATESLCSYNPNKPNSHVQKYSFTVYNYKIVEGWPDPKAIDNDSLYLVTGYYWDCKDHGIDEDQVDTFYWREKLYLKLK